MTENTRLYTIGEAGKICHVSAKTLRYYDKIGVVRPDVVSEENGYRYYSYKTLLRIPIIKYYKQLGFKLEETTHLLNGGSYHGVDLNFREKIDELAQLEQEAHRKYLAVHDWYELQREATIVSAAPFQEVSLRYIPAQDLVWMDQAFNYDYHSAIVNIPWTDYLDSAHCAITGAVILEFASFRDKMEGKAKDMRIMQRAAGDYFGQARRTTIGGTMACCLYHIGPHDTLNESYARILAWAQAHGYECGVKSWERYVIDYWTTGLPEEMVTELIVPVTAAGAGMAQE
jgi:DNA-binding transcriptional MerR regulator